MSPKGMCIHSIPPHHRSPVIVPALIYRVALAIIVLALSSLCLLLNM